MKTSLYIRSCAAPALGDVRSRLPGDVVYVFPDATTRPYWPRYLDALTAAIAAGADVRWVAKP